MSTPRELYFEVFQNGEYQRTETFAQDVIKIGSHPKSQIYVADEGVSRVHALVEVTGDDVHIIDLSSGRGTYVNGELIHKRRLENKDRIRVGQTEILFLTVNERAMAQAAEAKKKAAELPRDEVVYARRYLPRPSTSDGSVQLAVLFNDFVVKEELFKGSFKVVIGPGKAANVPFDHPSIKGDGFEIMDGSSGQPSLTIAPWMDGDIYVGGTRYRAADASSLPGARAGSEGVTIPFTAETRARLVIGDLTLFLRHTTRQPLALPLAFDSTSMSFAMISLMLHAFVVGALMYYVQAPDLGRDRMNISELYAQIIIEDQIEEEVLPEPEPEEGEEEEEEVAEETGEAAAGEEGRAGQEDIPEDQPQGRMAVEGDAMDPSEVELMRDEARAAVQDRGVLAAMNNTPTSAFGSAVPNGMDAINAIGAVQGNGVGASYGQGGLGRFGGGLGGGGRSMAGGFSGGPIALRNRNSGALNEAVAASVAVRDRAQAGGTVGIGGNVEIQGQLDREIIQRVVREHRREIRSCYESVLQRNPDLEGRVTINWVISPDGAVAAAQVGNTTLNSEEVESCVVRRVRQWRFPEPRGGGTVRVNFPFDFAPGG